MRSALNVLVGLPLTDLWRPLGQTFEFGLQKPYLNRKGEEIHRSDYRLHLLQEWRVTEHNVVVMGSDDHQTKRRFYRRKTPPRDPIARERWRRANRFFDLVKGGALLVERVTIDDSASIRIELTEGFLIEAINCSSDNYEVWIFDNDAEGRSLWVMPGGLRLFEGPSG